MPAVPSRPGRAWVMLPAVLAAFAAGGGVVYFLLRPAPGAEPRTGRSEAPSPNRVAALGRLQPAGGVVPVYGPPGDRIAEMKSLAPGGELKAGAPIAVLASRDIKAAELRVAEVQLEEAKAALAAAKAAGAKKIEAAKAELAQALAGEKADLAALDAKTVLVTKQRDAAARQLVRLDAARADGAKIAEEDVEKARLPVDQADAELAATAAAREKAVATYAGSRTAAEARLKAAEAELAEAEARTPVKSGEERLAVARQALDLATLKAPVDGVVLRVAGRTGQPTGTAEPVLQMAALGEMVVVAEVYESDVDRLAGWVKAGPVPVEVTHPALPKVLKGAVRTDADLSRMIARNQVFPLGPREDADRRVVEVTARLDADSAGVAARFVGLQVTATFAPAK
ncbi:HlyD family efflux transporter periplasmic adaptor subunit [bacterium]|nr:HlyD family efflux transporter periplasmic adaptor subunit [bacterium]